ncbi:MAG: DUF4124 domain-containing protein [Desulfobacterales bacterium]
MNRLNIIALILAFFGLAGFMIPAANADIYSWTDENGVRHFTNQTPPKHAELLIKSPEVSHDEEAHERRLEEDRLALARQELAEREAFLLQQQLEAERRIAAASARVEAALEQADQILQDAEAAAEANDNDSWGSYGYYYPYYRIGPIFPQSSYYRHDLSLYRKHPYKYRRHPYTYGYNKHKWHSSKYGHHNKHRSKGSTHIQHYRTNSHQSHYSLTRGRYTSHRARSAAFRGRHGRF